ncbi:MAG: hypothetical protein GF309_06810 [Candidatus Lokiarchaeota archaeon]|nr:hypothetical protein [Candidatus Lokiarchaeota archaeon]
MSKEEMIWDLFQLLEPTEIQVEGLQEEPDWPGKIEKQLKKAVSDAEAFRDKYRGKIEDMNAQELVEMLEKYDELVLKHEGPGMFASLRYAADSTDAISKQLNDAARRARMKFRQALAFKDIELGKLLSKNPDIVNAPEVSEYQHYLEKIKREVPYMLSEEKEQLIITKDKNGIDAWQQLQGDWLSTRKFEIEVDGEKNTMSYGEIIGLYEDPDRDLRKQANQIVYDNLGEDEIIWASAIRAVCSDHLEMCDIRDYPSPMTQSLIANDIEKEAVDSLMDTIENSVDIYRRYLRLKAKIMGLDKLGNWDIVAPLPDAPEKEYSWQEARNEVVGAYSSFDEQIGSWVDEMFENRHIDAEVREGKRSGAFCASWLAGKSAYILLSYNKRMGNLYTLAHENGHAVHDYLMAREQKPSNCEVGSCIAECGSIFGELLLTERLLREAKSKEQKQAVLATILDEFGMAAFQVSARVFFEKSMYDTIDKGKFLDGDTVAALWTDARDKIYGDAVEWLPEMRWEWAMKIHYFIPRYRFYNYPYIFAQLFVYALYRLYKEQGDEFVPKLKALLAAGSSKSPAELAEELGFDILSKKFWEKGMKQFEEFIDILEETIE